MIPALDEAKPWPSKTSPHTMASSLPR